MKFSDIKKFPFASYNVTIGWLFLQDWLDRHNEDILKVDMDPEYQRGYIWTLRQKVLYIEYQLKGGFSGRDIFWNCPTWMHFNDKENIIELVDGKQRINTVLEFLNNKIPVFGNYYYKDFEDSLDFLEPRLNFHVNNLKSRKEVIEWYIGFNAGGSIHTEEDLKPAFELLKRLENEI